MTDFFTMQPGETAAPVPDGPLLCGGTDSMRKVHRVFLWGYDEIPGLIRSAGDGDTERSAVVGEALRNFNKLLHTHHDGEDELMYPKLAARAPACALHVEEMLRHHAGIGRMLEELEPFREEWIGSASAALGERLAAMYEALNVELKIHLRREVTEVMPAVDRVLTEKEVMALAKHGTNSFSAKVMVGYLGMVLATNPPEERAEFFQHVPPPVRLAYRLVGRRLYRKQYAQLFPGREIPETL